MENKKQKTILIVTFLALILVFAGVTYAYFSANITGSESVSSVIVTGGKLHIRYDNLSSELIVENIYPRDQYWVEKRFTVTGTNTTDLKMKYKVGLQVVNSTFADGELTYDLTSSGIDNGAAVANVTQGSIPASGSVWFGSGYFETTESTAVHTYSLKIYFKDTGVNQNSAQEKTMAAYVLIDEAESETITETPGTLLAGIRTNYPTTLTPITIPGRAISASNEAILAETEDDYGTSYYFRGAVNNNYVSFANMCWRIVRVTGDRSIKLVLYNYASGDCTTEGASNAFARYSGTTYKSTFNTSSNKNAYVGFMYGTPGSSTYEAEHANNTDSTILTNLKTWYDAKLNINISQGSTKKYTDYLADTIWCNDKRLGSTEEPGYTNLGYNTEKTYYKAEDRLALVPSSASPSLKCGDTKEDNKISKYTASDTVNGNGKLKGINGVGDTEYKIGLLTVDEVAFAGGVFSQDNSTYYLNKNATDSFWWTMTPAVFGVNSSIWIVRGTGYLHLYNALGSNSLRPVVSLKSTVTISGGNGEAGTPFVISYS